MTFHHERVEHRNQIPALIAVLDKESVYKYFPTDIFIPSHWHRSVEITLIEDLEVVVQIENKEYLVYNDFTCINSSVVHSLIGRNLGDHPQAIIVLISYDFIKQFYPGVDEIVFDLSRKSNHDDLKELYYKLKDLYLHQDDYSCFSITACLLEILTLLFKEYHVKKHPLQKASIRNQELIKSVITYIHEHYQEDLSLSSLADHFHISQEYFSRQFHHYVGKTFRDYLSSYRLYKAYDDVVNGESTIQDIARVHGFLNVKSFIRVFRETYHETPLQYRKKISKK